MPYTTTWGDGAFDAAWDDFVAGMPGGELAQTTAWASVKGALGLGTRLAVVRSEAGAIVGGGVVVGKRLAPGVSVAYVARGPLASPAHDAAGAAAVRAVQAAARHLGARLLVVQPPERSGPVVAELTKRGYRPGAPAVAPQATVRLDITVDEVALLAGMTSMRRRGIKSARRADLEIEQSDDVALFHRLHTASGLRQAFTPLTLENLSEQWSALASRGHCSILVARHGGRPVAALWLTSFAGTVTLRHVGWDSEVSAPKHVNEALHWTAMQIARAGGAHTYDLGGFDARAADLILAGQELPPEFYRSPHFFKLGFGPPTRLPGASYRIGGRAATRALGRVGDVVLQAPVTDRALSRLRNG